jgi:hypothetical protein
VDGEYENDEVMNASRVPNVDPVQFFGITVLLPIGPTPAAQASIVPAEATDPQNNTNSRAIAIGAYFLRSDVDVFIFVTLLRNNLPFEFATLTHFLASVLRRVTLETIQIAAGNVIRNTERAGPDTWWVSKTYDSRQ